MHYKELRWRIPVKWPMSKVDENHKKTQDYIFDNFMKSFYADYITQKERKKLLKSHPLLKIVEPEVIDDLTQYSLPTYKSHKPLIPKSVYKDLTTPLLEEVVIATAQALTKGNEVPSRECCKEIISTIDDKFYYRCGGLGDWFDNFCSRISHWYDIVKAIEYGNIVTVYIEREEDKTKHFTNLVGTLNKPASSKGESNAPIENADEYFFITTNGELYSLNQLMRTIQTAPWKWIN